jgi:hypothetical protein
MGSVRLGLGFGGAKNGTGGNPGRDRDGFANEIRTLNVPDTNLSD